MKKTYLFTSESVSEGHPDKVADQISDAILDEFLRQDSEAKVAVETFCTTGLVLVGGEVLSDVYVDIQQTARDVIREIGYDKSDYMFDANSCGIISAIHSQSQDINRGVERGDPLLQGAGDQGMMFGYACTDTEDLMPLPLYLAHLVLKVLSDIRKNRPGVMPYLRPDAKSQITVEYDAETHKPLRIHTIVLSTQHDEFAAPTSGAASYAEAVKLFGEARADEMMRQAIEDDIRDILLPEVIRELPPEAAALFDGDTQLLVNPTGKFVIGGPHGDTGLTGRKIIVDTYGGKASHGGGAFSGKDPSKVDRSAAYMARYIAKNMVAAGVADEMLVQLAYAIGVAEPVSIFVNSYGTAKNNLSDSDIAQTIGELFDLRPAAIVERFALKNPIYLPTASYGHMGRKPFVMECTLNRNGTPTTEKLQFFGWEKLDSTDLIRRKLLPGA